MSSNLQRKVLEHCSLPKEKLMMLNIMIGMLNPNKQSLLCRTGRRELPILMPRLRLICNL